MGYQVSMICIWLTSRRAIVLRKRNQATVDSMATIPRTLVRTHNEPVFRTNIHSLHKYRERLLNVALSSDGTSFAGVTLGGVEGCLITRTTLGAQQRKKLASRHVEALS